MATKPERQNERATLLQVATLAGVSTSTVSLVLAGKSDRRRIAENTRDRVRRAAEDLNYAPNLLTRSLRKGRTNILSFFSTFRHRERDDLYMDKLSSAIETAGGAKHFDILVHCNFSRSPKEIAQFLNGGLADGLLLFAPRPDDPLLAMLRKTPLPMVLINGRDPEAQYSSVADDVEEGMRLVSNELQAAGHRRIAAFLGVGVDARDANTRVALLQENLALDGLEIPGAWIPHVGEDPMPVLKRLLDDPKPPTAIFCWHDRLAYKVLAACESLGISVPDQVSIIGYDGLHWPSATKHVAASVQVDLDALARMAVSLLDQTIHGNQGPACQGVLPVTFSPGTSLGPAPSVQRITL